MKGFVAGGDPELHFLVQASSDELDGKVNSRVIEGA